MKGETVVSPTGLKESLGINRIDCPRPPCGGVEIVAEYPRLSNPEMGTENENPGALAGATGADLHGSRVADEDSLKRTEAARALAAAVSDCDPRDRIPLLKRLLDYHLGIGRGFFLAPGDWS